MSTHLHLDSQLRNKTEFPNAAEFKVLAVQSAGWSTQNRNIGCAKQNCKPDDCRYVYTVELNNLTIPYVQEIYETRPYLFVELCSGSICRNRALINTIGNVENEAVFAVYFDHIQGTTPYTSRTATLHYKARMVQTMIFDTKSEIRFKVYAPKNVSQGPSGVLQFPVPTDPADPFDDVTALFTITPFKLDNRYDDKHFTEECV